MATSKKSIVVFISILLLLLPLQPSTSCGWYPEVESYRVSVFRPDLSSMPSLHPFYFTSYFLYDGESPTNQAAGKKVSVQEWYAYLDKQVSAESIEEILYATDPEAFVRTMEIDQGTSITSHDTLFSQPFIRHLLKTNDRETLSYLVFAKKCEYLNAELDPWEDEVMDVTSVKKLVAEGKAAYTKAKSKVLKVRYGYQLVVLARYLKDYSLCIALYNELIEPLKTESIVKYWALAHKATATYHTGKGAEADYLFSRVFQHADNKKIRAYQGFEGSQLDSTLRLARNRDEQAGIRVMDALKNPGRSLKELQAIYELSPKSKELEMLLIREINKLEDWVLTSRLTELEPANGHEYRKYEHDSSYNLVAVIENYNHDIEYLRSVQEFVIKVIHRKKMHDPALWNLAAGYLAFIDNRFDEAKRYLAAAERSKGKEDNIATQIHLTNSMLLVRPDKDKQVLENELLRELTWLEANKEKIFNYEKSYNSLLLVLIEQYRSAGNLLMASLLQAKVTSETRFEWNKWEYSNYFYYLDEQAKPAQMDSLLRLLDKKNKTPFEQYITKDVMKDQWRLTDLYGTLLLREDQLAEALAIYQRIPEEFWANGGYAYESYLNANPFYVDFYTEHELTKADTITYNKTQFVANMLELKKKAASATQNQAYYYYLLANGYYNMTYYGNSWMMTKYWWSMHEPNTYNTIFKASKEYDIYYGCKRAQSYYLKAMQTSKDSGFAALCCRMAGKCEKNWMVYQQQTNRKKEIKTSVESNQFYRILKTKYPQFYDELLEECTSFDKFLARHTKS